MATTKIQTFEGNVVILGQLTVSGVSEPYAPTNGVVLWYGSIASIPPGWALCDGTNGTPDLRNRFIIGAGSSYNYSQTGGNASVTLSTSNLPGHSHYAATSTAYQSHNHSYQQYHYPFSYFWNRNNVGGATWWAQITNYFSTAPIYHQHSAYVYPAGSGQSFQTLPPYYSLAYIMKL